MEIVQAELTLELSYVNSIWCFRPQITILVGRMVMVGRLIVSEMSSGWIMMIPGHPACAIPQSSSALNYQIINCSNNNYKDIYKARPSPVYIW